MRRTKWKGTRDKTGVYLIWNTVTMEQYVGASINIAGRLCTHFGREAKNNTTCQIYEDMRIYGVDKFDWKVLEFCTKDELLECEQKWYDLLNPYYNQIRPRECSFTDPYVRDKAHSSEKYYESIEKRKGAYLTPYYKKLFRNVQRHRFKRVEMLQNNTVVAEFETMMDGQKWLNEHTSFTGKNKVSKIKAVCDGERAMAFGYSWRYKV